MPFPFMQGWIFFPSFFFYNPHARLCVWRNQLNKIVFFSQRNTPNNLSLRSCQDLAFLVTWDLPQCPPSLSWPYKGGRHTSTTKFSHEDVRREIQLVNWGLTSEYKESLSPLTNCHILSISFSTMWGAYSSTVREPYLKVPNSCIWVSHTLLGTN